MAEMSMAENQISEQKNDFTVAFISHLILYGVSAPYYA